MNDKTNDDVFEKIGASNSALSNVFHDSISDHLQDFHNKNLRSPSSSTASEHDVNFGVGVPMLDIKEILDTYQQRIVMTMREEIKSTIQDQFREQTQNIEKLIKENAQAIGELHKSQDGINIRVETVETDQKKLINDLNELKCSHTSLDQDIVETKNIMDEIQKELKEKKGTIANLRSEIDIIKNKLEEQGKKHDSLDQYGRRLNLEIHGYKKKTNEDVIDIVVKVAKMVNVSLKKEDISAAHRLRPREDEADTGIIVRFCRQDKRDELYRKKASLMKFNTGEDIFINENLSDLQRDLFYRARIVKKEKGYKYAYTYHGNVFVRKNKGADALKLSCITDLEKIR